MANITCEEQCVVMVTGGSGFLGQHVIKLLNTNANHVASIRVVDLVPFKNKLDYKLSKPIRIFVGSITDEILMREAMTGCHCVIHLAAFANIPMFQNKEKLQEVHVEGTAVALSVAQSTPSVERFIGCGTSVVLKTSSNIIDGTEETPIPTKWLFQDYTSTKYASEQMVVAANSETFHAIVLRPTTMYGELDDINIASILWVAKQSGNIVFQINCGENKHQLTYVGNVAWGFVCAEKRLYEGQKALNESLKKHKDDIQESKVNTIDRIKENNDHALDIIKDLKTIDGQAYFIADDTPNQNFYQFADFYAKACGFRMCSLKIPYYLVLIIAYIFYFFLYFLSLFGIKLNMNFSIPAVRFLNSTLIVSYEKAKIDLGYVPLFTPEEAKENSLRFYKELEKWRTT